MTEATLAILAVLLLIDWRQTLFIARNPDRFHESWNLVLDRNPSELSVNMWFGFCAVLGVVVSVALWDHWALVCVAGSVAVIELAAVVNNHKLGIRP